jgi:hypothetical protein
MADQKSTKTSYTVLSGESLLLPKPDGEIADWTPVQLAEDKVEPTANNRLFVKRNDDQAFAGAGQPGTRKLRIAIGGSQVESTDENTILLQLVAPGFDPADLSASLPVPTVTLGAETQDDAALDEAALAAINTVAGLGASIMLRDIQADGSMTAVVRLGAIRPAHGNIVIDLDFGYSASN